MIESTTPQAHGTRIGQVENLLTLAARMFNREGHGDYADARRRFCEYALEIARERGLHWTTTNAFERELDEPDAQQ